MSLNSYIKAEMNRLNYLCFSIHVFKDNKKILLEKEDLKSEDHNFVAESGHQKYTAYLSLPVSPMLFRFSFYCDM